VTYRRRRVNKRIHSLVIALAIPHIFSVPGTCQQQIASQEKQVRKIRKYVTRLKRWAPEDPITVKLNDGTKVKVYIAEVTNDHFVVTNRSGGQPTTIDWYWFSFREWHGRLARESRARYACHNQTAPARY
jgi:hypothetical protein